MACTTIGALTSHVSNIAWLVTVYLCFSAFPGVKRSSPSENGPGVGATCFSLVHRSSIKGPPASWSRPLNLSLSSCYPIPFVNLLLEQSTLMEKPAIAVSETDDEIANEGVHAKTLILVLVLVLPEFRTPQTC